MTHFDYDAMIADRAAGGLVGALRSGRQADMDGCFVTVSRQACEEAADKITEMEAEIIRLRTWHPIATAPTDRPILVYCPPREGLPELICTCRYHEDAGFCVDELREVTHWMELPKGPGE